MRNACNCTVGILGSPELDFPDTVRSGFGVAPIAEALEIAYNVLDSITGSKRAVLKRLGKSFQLGKVI